MGFPIYRSYFCVLLCYFLFYWHGHGGFSSHGVAGGNPQGWPFSGSDRHGEASVIRRWLKYVEPWNFMTFHTLWIQSYLLRKWDWGFSFTIIWRLFCTFSDSVWIHRDIYWEVHILTDWNLEPRFGNFPYPEKVPGTTRSDLGKIDKNYDIFTFCETVHGNQNLEPLRKMVLGEPKMTTLSQFFTRKVPVKLAE